VARVAGVLAIAIFGLLMVTVFTSRLSHALQSSGIPTNLSRQVQASAIQLAGLELPPGLDPTTANIIKEQIAHAFVFGFRLIILLCAALAIASGIIALVTISPNALGSPTKANRSTDQSGIPQG